MIKITKDSYQIYLKEIDMLMEDDPESDSFNGIRLINVTYAVQLYEDHVQELKKAFYAGQETRTGVQRTNKAECKKVRVFL